MNAPEPKTDLKVVGKRLPRVDAGERVTGRAVYPADFKRPGMVWGRVKRSTQAHARILRIDTSRAASLKGVLAIVTAADFPEVPMGSTIPFGETGQDLWVISLINMAREKVLWIGQPVAAVAAADPHVAAQAIDLIEVEYDPLPAVMDIEAALAPGAPILHGHLITKGVEPAPAHRLECRRAHADRPWRRGSSACHGCSHRRAAGRRRHGAPGLPRAAGDGGGGRSDRVRDGLGLHARARSRPS